MEVGFGNAKGTLVWEMTACATPCVYYLSTLMAGKSLLVLSSPRCHHDLDNRRTLEKRIIGQRRKEKSEDSRAARENSAPND